MGFDLTNGSADFRFSVVAWHKALDLARQYGWQPAGTQPALWGEEDENGEMVWTATESWSGTYTTNDYQSVTQEDAHAIADALDRALPDIPDHPDMPPQVAPARPGVGVTGRLLACLPEMTDLIGPNETLHPFEFFGGTQKQKVVEFIAFCRQGAFRIG